MGSTDRINGFNSAVALKAPVAACATAEIVLAGEQSIDGVSLVDGDRVLVTQQSNPVDNGIYVVTTSNWSRAKDFNGHRDAVKGTRVAITDGEIYAGYEAQLTTENPVQIGASELIFVLLLILDPNDADAVRTVAQNISSIQSASDNAALAQQAREGAETAEADAQQAEQGAVTARGDAELARDAAQTYRDEAQTAAQNTFSTYVYTATGGETSLSGPDDNANTLAYVPGVLIAEMNGAILEDGADFTATNGTSITGLTALTAGDTVIIRAFGSFSVTAEMDAIVAEGATQVANVQAEGGNQITAVQAEGTTQVAAVQAEGTTQTTNMQTYAQQMADIVNNTYSGAFFEMDGNGDVMPTLSPIYSETYELDGNGDIQPL